ncbi:MAG: SDR family NAD(P)-dependent oxidoreductase, partial [Halobacteria archaeon]|nr:SDR family NAD(P)-dependent oxidoreductase [Halobacteria archaeon]
AGADVVIGDIDYEGAEEVADEIEGETANTVVPLEVDVSDKQQVDEMVDTTVEEFGKLDVAFANAGIAELEAPVQSYTADQWERITSVNFDGVFYTDRAAAEVMKNQGHGSIINTASIYGLVGDDTIGTFAYAASKGGVVQMTKTLAANLAPDVRVNAIAPGPVRTGIGQGFMKEDAEGMEQVHEMIEDKTPMDRLAYPEDMKGMALYLASEASGYCTGYVYAVDGGWTSI